MKKRRSGYIYVLCGVVLFVILIVLLFASRISRRTGYVSDMAEFNKTFKFWKPFDFPTEGPLFYVEEGGFPSWGIIVFGNLSKVELLRFLEAIPKSSDITDSKHKNMKEDLSHSQYQRLRRSSLHLSSPSFRISKWARERIHPLDWKKLGISKLHSNADEYDYVFSNESGKEQYPNIFISGQLNMYNVFMNVNPESGQFIMELWERYNSGH